MASALTSWLDEVVGEHTVTRRLPTNVRKAHRGQRVRRVQLPAGGSWILKEVTLCREWRAEDHAYRHWVPAVEDRAPTMLASHEELGALVVSEVSGRHPRGAGPAVHRQAGALLRRLHEARPARKQSASDRELAAERLERLIVEAGDVLTRSELSFVRAQADRLAALPLGHVIPCHGDYRPHNWLLDGSGTLRMIDFGKARWNLPAWDLGKLFLRPWWRRPRLASAFLEGYGRPLHAEEAEFIQARMAVDALSHAAFGAARRSERHVCFGRSRLGDLMAGHRLVPASMCRSR